MSHSIRMSRLQHPRATFWAIALLAGVFLLFGVWANANVPASAPVIQAPGPVAAGLSRIVSIGR